MRVPFGSFYSMLSSVSLMSDLFYLEKYPSYFPQSTIHLYYLHVPSVCTGVLCSWQLLHSVGRGSMGESLVTSLFSFCLVKIMTMCRRQPTWNKFTPNKHAKLNCVNKANFHTHTFLWNFEILNPCHKEAFTNLYWVYISWDKYSRCALSILRADI